MHIPGFNQNHLTQFFLMLLVSKRKRELTMKVQLLVCFLMFSLTNAMAAGQTYTYLCHAVQGSDDESIKISLKISDSHLSYQYLGDSTSGFPEQPCEATQRHLTRDGKKFAYGVSGCEADARITVSKEMVEGGLKLRDGKLGGFARIDNYDDGGYFKTNLVCFKK